MGDRAQLQLTDGLNSVFLYTHWNGYNLPTILAAGLDKARDGGRLTDPTYCLAIVAKQFFAATGGTGSTTGAGLGFEFGDNDDEHGGPLVFNIADGTVSFGINRVSIEDFLKSPAESVGWR